MNPLTLTDGTHVSDMVTDTRLKIPCDVSCRSKSKKRERMHGYEARGNAQFRGSNLGQTVGAIDG